MNEEHKEYYALWRELDVYPTKEVMVSMISEVLGCQMDGLNVCTAHTIRKLWVVLIVEGNTV